MMNNSQKPARDMGVVALFFLILALSACSFSSWWYFRYMVAGGQPAVTLPTATTAAINAMGLNFQTRFLKKYTIYGVRTETHRTVFQNNARTAEGECQTVTNQYLWSRTQHTKCIFEFNSYNGFGTEAAKNAAEANMDAWCSQRCDDVKADRKPTCDSVAYDIGRAGHGISETEFEEELLCGHTGGGSFSMMVTVMIFALLGLVLALFVPGMRAAILAMAGLCFVLLLTTAVLYGVKTATWVGSTHDNEGFASDMVDNAKYGLDVGYALLILLNLLAVALLAYLLKPAPKPEPTYQLAAQPVPPVVNDVVFHEPVKREAAPPAAPAAPANTIPVTFVQSPYQNMGMQTYPFVPGLNGAA